MNAPGRSDNNRQTAHVEQRGFRLVPIAHAIALVLGTGGILGSAYAAQPFSAGWYGSRSALQETARTTGMVNGRPVSSLNPQAQQQQANTQLKKSIDNLTLAAHGIAMQQAAQAARRQAELGNPSSIPNGLSVGGLDADSLASSWTNANAPTQTTDANGNIVVDIRQTADKAIANWNTFNVGKNTIVQFDQASADWAILNRITDPLTRPSQIQGQIKAPGTVLIVNRNGIVFSGTSQINTRNFVAAAAAITDTQFTTNGLYGPGQTPSFTDAAGKIEVQAGAQITTNEPTSVTQGGGYVLLMGSEVSNAGQITTRKGQTELAAGDSFIIRKGVDTVSNTASTTRGNEISPQFNDPNSTGKVSNTGLILSREGDITLAGRDVQQNGVAIATTTVNTRGTIHLLNSASDTQGVVTLGNDSTTAVVLEDDGKTTALDSQRDALIADSATQDKLRGTASTGVFDNLATLADRRDQSRIEIVSGGDVNFEGNSLALATGGQIAVSATSHTLVKDNARLDVSGAVGVNLAMASNNVLVNVQGNELRDAPLNRDSGNLFNSNVWIDKRDLIYVPAGTDGYASDRWYTAGGLLEVSGYLNNQGHGIGEWAAQGGTVLLGGNDVMTQAGSQINLSGGTLNVQTGFVKQTWLVGSDGQLYNANNAPADMTFRGVYKGFEAAHPRWGKDASEFFYNPLIAPQQRLENGYTVGRDAGRLIVSASNALMQGDIVANVYNGPQQVNARPVATEDIDGYKLGQTQAALAGRFAVETFDPASGIAMPVTSDVMFGEDTPPVGQLQGIWLDAHALSGFNLGGISVLTTGDIAVDSALNVAAGGVISLAGTNISTNADITARGGRIFLGENDSVLQGLEILGKDLVGTVSVASGIRLDTRGLWSNLLTDPDAFSGLAFIDGGDVDLRSIGDVTLNKGALIDASAGGAILTNGKSKGGAGGDIVLFANDTGSRTAPDIGELTLNGEIRSVGFSHGGALTINTGTAVVIGDHTSSPNPGLELTPDFFSKGFSSYSINGDAGLTVAAGTDINVVQPVYRFTDKNLTVPTGSDIESAADIWMPPLYIENPITAQLTQRPGADLTLLSGIEGNVVNHAVGGNIDIGSGAMIMVDPGRSVRIASGGQITVDGKITAPGGNISIVNNRPLGGVAGPVGIDPGGLSIWIGGNAVLDASAPNDSFAYDTQGRPYGFVMDGGSIVLGSDGGSNDATKSKISTDAMVIVRPGAIIDASGASVALDLNVGTSISSLGGGAASGGAQMVASNGGSITMRSYDGIYNDGTLRAVSGGAGAAGGTLSLELESPIYTYDPFGGGIAAIPVNLKSGRIITVSQNYMQSGLAADLQSGNLDPALLVGQARISAQQIQEGGFDTLSLYGRSGITFDGDVTLNAGRSISLLKGPLFNTVAGANVVLNAPYIFFGGQTEIKAGGFTYVPADVPTYPIGGTLSANASLIDVQNTVRSVYTKTSLESQGELRFLKSDDSPSVGLPTTNLIAHGNLDLVAAQIYPTSGALVDVYAGVDTLPSFGNAEFNTDSIISIGSVGGAVPAQPYSVFGNISFLAESIRQGGVVRAPLGSITLGQSYDENSPGAGTTSLVQLSAGSITSVSAAGLVIPYGGTVDGVKYTVDGDAPAAPNAIAGSFTNDANSPIQGIRINGIRVVGEAESHIDVSGGGVLAGAAFISGRGGSVDTLMYPLKPGGVVYAIVPGVKTAPVIGGAASAWTGAAPTIGEQITIPAGVPGLAAGTYTLLPANYALLPGAYRIELGARETKPLAGVVSLPNGSYMLNGVQSVANTAIRDSLSTSITVTPGATVRTYSQYNEQGYDAYELAQAATFGLPRPLLPADGKFLQIHLGALPSGSTSTTDPALAFEGSADFKPGVGGYGGTLILTSQTSGIFGEPSADFAITGPNSTSFRTEVLTPIAASTINAFEAPNLYLGGAPAISQSLASPGAVTFGSMANAITIENGAILNAAQISLLGSTITLESGARISTLGQSILAPNVLGGYLQGGSNIASNVSLTGNTINVEDGASIYADGELRFNAFSGVIFGENARFGAKNLTLALPSINIGNADTLAAATLAGTLPVGLSLDQAFLERLLKGDSAAGAPAVENLTLSASQSINFYGSVDLNTFDSSTGKYHLDQFILNSPAIYGYGSATDIAHLTVDTLVWNNVGTLPGAIVTNGPGTGLGILNVDANRIVFGYPSQSQPNNQASTDRLLLGFSTVNLNASDRITANNKASLAVYASGPDPSVSYDPKTYTGIGGNLNLITPLLTGDPGSVMDYKVGGALTIAPPSGIAASIDTPSALGAEINMSATSIVASSAIVLPSGKLTMTAVNDIILADGSRIDLSGQTIPFFDVTKYSWGGDVALESAHGNIIQSAGSVIDISAGNEDAGTLKLTATDASAGGVLLGGTLRGGGGQDLSGGMIDVRAQRIGADAANLTSDFVALNNTLNAGGFFGSRSFDLKQGSLVIGDEVHAHQVAISIDGGSLVVNGTIDASGAAPGMIRLAARDDLTLAATAVLDAHGEELQKDSYGVAIEAKNRGAIELTSSEGWLTLAPGATLDLSTPDGVARGKIELNTGRTGEMSGDMRIAAAGPVNILGAASIAANGFWAYSPIDADGTIVQDNGGADPLGADGSIGLNQIDQRNVTFMDAALANADLQGRLAGLAAYDTPDSKVFHLRPGVEINSKDTPNGNLTVKGDLDLSGFRYGPDADRNTASMTYGAGEVASLVIRASGNLDIKGSINDGFAPPPAGPSEPTTITVHAGDVLTADIAGVGPNLVLEIEWTVPPNSFVQMLLPDGDVIRLSEGTTLPAGTELLRSTGRFLIPAGTPSPITYQETTVGELPGPPLYAIAPMLAAGSMSSSLRLVGGADLGASDTRTLQPASILQNSGNLTLSDSNIIASSGLPVFSVIRTGTGSLDLLVGGNFSQDSLYGIYTAGTNTLLPNGNADFSSQGTYYPDHGGDLRVVAQGNLSGLIYEAPYPSTANTYSIADWLWRQGDDNTNSAWSINFGSYNADQSWVQGFTGFGALGGGNITLLVGKDAGNLEASGIPAPGTSAGLIVAIGGTGRVTSVTTSDGVVIGGTLVQTGGGDVTMKIGGRLNPGLVDSSVASHGDDFNGSITNLRGDIHVDAGAIGAIPLRYAVKQVHDPRAVDPFTATMTLEGGPTGGLVLLPGDTNVTLRSRGDLVLGGVGDAGQVTPLGLDNSAPGTWFTLWKPSTSIDLFSAGGNLTPLNYNIANSSASANEAWSPLTLMMLPPTFRAVAASGSLYYGGAGTIELAPSVSGQLELLAQGSIYAAGVYNSITPVEATRFALSGAPSDYDSIPNPFKPAFKTANQTNTNLDSGFFSFKHDTTDSIIHTGDQNPIRVYAVTGDIVNFLLGDQIDAVDFSTSLSYIKTVAAKAAYIRAGRDIVSFGNFHNPNGSQPLESSVIMNTNDTDVSIISAGRDMFYTNVLIAGPGSLEISAGRNLYQGDSGIVTSIGSVVPGDNRPGANILMQAGLGSSGPNYAALKQYLDPDNLLASGTPLDGSGKVAKTYENELADWVKQRYSFDGTTGEVLAYFDLLGVEQQDIFLRQIYFAELRAGGREYNNPDSPRFGSYLRGRNTIAALFPDQDANGVPIVRQGDITMFGGSGVRTLFGGDIQMLTPGGKQVIGVEGIVPPPTSGIVTQGNGDIQLYSKGSVLLGLSRIMTTFGGDILAWSGEGDINAGRGSKTTVVYTPPKREYDDFGNVTLSPDVPSTGAGIATLNPIPETPPGDVDLIAPLGTIDVGEAGIRVSGNVNLAALQVVNAANIQVQGKTTGIPTIAAVNVGTLTNAGAAATQATIAAQDVVHRQQVAARQALPSIFTVRVLGFGNEPADGAQPMPQSTSTQQQSSAGHYDASSPLQFVGAGRDFDPGQMARLSDQQRRLLQQPK